MSTEQTPNSMESIRALITTMENERHEFNREYYRKTEEFRLEMQAMEKLIQQEQKIRKRELDRLSAEEKKERKRMEQSIGYVGNVQGEIAEDLFRRNISNLMNSIGIRVDEVMSQFKASVGPIEYEYDIVAINSHEIFVFEIKNKLKLSHIVKFLEEQLPRFTKIFPQYKGMTIHGGLGALVIKEQLEQYVLRNGLFLLTQSEQGAATLHCPETWAEHRS